MNKKLKKKIAGLVTGIAVIGIALILDKLGVVSLEGYLGLETTQTSSKTGTTTTNASSKLYDVVRVVDGDTFIIEYNGKQERVRLIGVDTPESVHPNEEKNTEFGDEVSKYSKKMLTGKQVSLEFDVDERDQYGRLLAYVYLDGQMYNKLLLEKGYAQVSTYPPNVKYVNDFTAIQKKARENKVGMWEY